jgi:hypothetical protein
LAARTSEDEEITRMGIALQRLLNLKSQAVHAAPLMWSST